MNPITLKPITILVGRNSSGKSTYLRSFPLIRQSILTRTSSPILWYGDLVDFGSYETSVRDRDVKKNIEFEFSTDRVNVFDHTIGFRVRYRDREDPYIKCSFKITIAHVGSRTRVRDVILQAKQPQVHYLLSFDDDGKLINLEVNGRPANDVISPLNLCIGTGSMFPNIHSASDVNDRNDLINFRHYGDIVIEPMVVFLKENFRRQGDKIYNEIALRLITSGNYREDFISENAKSYGNSQWKKFLDDIINYKNPQLTNEFFHVLFTCIMSQIFNSTSQELKSTLSETLYIGPMRARSERYYRYQDLAVSEIDPDGKNFPMFLNSLTESQVSDLSRWIESLFGYGIRVERGSAGHISIQLTERGKAAANIVDVGYGVSQILPVLAQIWWSRARRTTYERRGRSSPILAIEQPELHLHPAHQALLANALVGEAVPASQTSDRDRITFLVETHSETFINRLGELICSGRLAADDVQIVVFEPDKRERVTRARVSTFNNDGILENWPFGFFQPAMDEI